MRHLIKTAVSILICFCLFQCGSNPLEEGSKAFENQQYSQAIEFFNQVWTADIPEGEYAEMLALAYLYRGEQVYDRTKNIDAFQLNFDMAEKYISGNTSEEFNKKYVELLLKLAESYSKAGSQNSELYQKHSIMQSKYLGLALEYDSTNTAVIDAIEEMKKNNFQKNLEAAKRLYSKGKKKGEKDLFLSAKIYLQKAAEYNSKDTEVIKLKSRLRTALLPVLETSDGISMAAVKSLKKENHLILMLAVENYQKSAVKIKPENFKLTDSRGSKYLIDPEEMKLYEFLGQQCLKSTTLDKQSSYTDGLLVFNVPQDAAISYLSYCSGDDELSRKYFR